MCAQMDDRQKAPANDQPVRERPERPGKALFPRLNQRNEQGEDAPGPLRRALQRLPETSKLLERLQSLAGPDTAGFFADTKKAEPALRQLFSDLKELKAAKPGLDQLVRAYEVDKSLQNLEKAAPGSIGNASRTSANIAELLKTLPPAKNEQVRLFREVLQADAENLSVVANRYQEFNDARAKRDPAKMLSGMTNLKSALDTFQKTHDTRAAKSELYQLAQKVFEKTAEASGTSGQPALPKVR